MNLVKPFNDELLSSWLFRLSRVNYTNLENIYYRLFTKKLFYIKDIDLYTLKENDLKKDIDFLTIEDLQNHQLVKLEGYIEETINKDGRHRWVTPFKGRHKSSKTLTVRYCPICLKEESYIRFDWRLLFINVCSKHHCFLHNRCSECGKELHLIPNDYTQELYTCHSCKSDLRETSPLFVKENSNHIKQQATLTNIMNRGYYKLNNRYYYSIGLFYLLRILIKNIMRAKDYNSLVYIEQLSPQKVSYLISYAMILLKNYPHRLNNFYKKYKFTNLHRILDKYQLKTNNIPNWYLSNIQFNTISTRWRF